MFANAVAHFSRVRMFPLLLAACLAFAGCADTANMTPAQRALEQSKRRFVATTAEGAVAGAALGALLGYAAGGGRGALIGAAAGGVAGGVAGAAVAQNNYQHSQTEGNLQSYINEANQQASDAQQDANNAAQIASEARAKTAQLRAQLRSGQITSAQYRSQIASYSQSLQQLRQVSDGQAQQIAAYRRDSGSAGADGSSLRAAGESIARSKAAVDRSIMDLNATLAAEPS